MKTTLSAEQKELIRSISSLFASECPTSLVRKLQGQDEDPEPGSLWKYLVDMGVFNIALPEDAGGYGTLFDLGLIYEQGGRVLCPNIIYTTIEFGIALARLAPSSQEWLGKAATGEILATTAISDPGNSSDVTPALRAEWTGVKWRLSGQIDFVQNADAVDVLLTTARVRQSAGGFHDIAVLIPRGVIKTHRLKTFARDSQCRVSLEGLEIGPECVLSPIDRADLRWAANAITALRCMDMVGGAQAVIDQTVAYLKERIQFGRPLASFQAAQHHIANMHIAAEGARFAAYQAVSLIGSGKVAERETAIAKLKANEAYKLVTLTAHQLYGGMGFVLETDLHLWSERAKAMELRDGAWETQIDRLATAIQLRP